MNSSRQIPKRTPGVATTTPSPSTVMKTNSYSSQTRQSNPGPSTTGTGPGTSTGGETTTPKSKNKRKKNGTKEERLRRREEKKFNEMYAPKDTRVSLISASVLEQFRGLSVSQSSKSTPVWNPEASRSEWPSVSISTAAAVHSPPGLSHSVNGQGASTTRDLKPAVPMDFEFPVLGTPVGITRPPIPKPVRLVWNKVQEIPPDREESKPILTHEVKTVVDGDQADLDVSTSTNDDATAKLTKFISKGRSKKPLVVSMLEFIVPKKEPLDGELHTPKFSKILPKSIRQSSKKLQKPGNLLDSSGPIVTHRGKIRKPKVKKPTPLKRAILTSRALRRVTIGAHFGPGQHLDMKFEAEIKPEIMNMPAMTITMDPDVKNDPDEILDIKPGKEELLFRKLVEETVSEAQKKLVTVPDSVFLQVKTQMHSRKFRSYCDMYVTKELHGHVIGLLKFLHRLQDKLYHTDPVKFNTKRRYVIGLKNVKSYLSLHKVRFIIIAPDMEKNSVEGGLDEAVEDLIELAKNLNVPFIFSGHRFILGYPIFIKTPVAAIGVLDYQGGEDLLRKILEEAGKLRENYKAEFDKRVQELCKSEDASAAANTTYPSTE